MYRHAVSTAFKNWHSLALAAVLYAVSVFLIGIGNPLINQSTQNLQGWLTIVIAGYLFISAVYLVSSTLTENSTLSEAFPGVIDHFKTFIVGAIAFTIGYFLLFSVAPPLQSTQTLAAAITLIVGGAIYLVSILVGVAAAFVRPKPLYFYTEKDTLNRVTVLKEIGKEIYLVAGRYSKFENDSRLYTPLTDAEKGEVEKQLRMGRKDALISFL